MKEIIASHEFRNEELQLINNDGKLCIDHITHTIGVDTALSNLHVMELFFDIVKSDTAEIANEIHY